MKLVFGTGTSIDNVVAAGERFVPGVDISTGKDGIELSVSFDKNAVQFLDVVNAVRAAGALTTVALKETDGTTVATYAGYTSLVRVGREISMDSVDANITFRAVKLL